MKKQATLLTVEASKPDPAILSRAALTLREGGLVAFPTETVYGLGADATNDRAVAAIYEAKGRPRFNPLIVHVDSVSALQGLVVMNEVAHKLATAFMPGALTLVLPRQKESGISWLCSAGTETLAVRIPSHAVALAFLRAAEKPVAAPSANRSGSISPTTPLHVMESLGERIDLILGAGRCPIGVESTVVDLSGNTPTLLRPGGITREQLEAVAGPLALAKAVNEDNPSAPGQMESHYAPNALVRLHATLAGPDEAFLLFGPELGLVGGVKRLNLSPTGDLHEAAANLFAMLRELDTPAIRSIAVASIPMHGLGMAINDRLRRAAAPREKVAA